MSESSSSSDRNSLRPVMTQASSQDIEIEKNKVRERCLELCPDRERLYEMVYESRFRRLWEQFRCGGEEVC